MDNNIFSNLFVRVLNISMVSCYTIIAVMVFRALILRWERKYAYLLWFVVFVNLCIPFRISGPFSLVPAWIADFDIAEKSKDKVFDEKTDYLPNETIMDTVSVSGHYYQTSAEEGNGVPGTDSNSEAANVQSESEGKTDYLPNEEIVVTTLPNQVVTETVSRTEHYYNVPADGENGVAGLDRNSPGVLLALVWGIGVFLLAAGNIRSVWRLQSKLKNADPFVVDGTSDEGTNKGIKITDGIETPFLWGLLSPSIYLPRTIDGEERTYIIAHESYHRKRKDYIFKPLFFIIAVIHWFNPLVWAAYLLFVRDMEISCDEAVIANAGEDIRKRYAESLLKYAARQNGYTLTPITFGEPSLKCRIKNVLHYKESNVIFSAMLLCFVIVIMIGLIVKPRQAALKVLPDKQDVRMTSGISAVDTVIDIGDIALDKTEASSQEINWKSDIIEGIDGENQYTKMLMESNAASGKAADFRTFAYEMKNGEAVIAYVLAGEIEGESISGNLWRVETDMDTSIVHPVMQNITMTDTQIELLVFEDAGYGIINYQADDGTEGRILPFTKNVLSTEIMSDISGEKRIGDVEGTVICGGYAYWVIDADTVEPVDEIEWNPGIKHDNYQAGQ